MAVARLRNAITEQKFHFRSHVVPLSGTVSPRLGLSSFLPPSLSSPTPLSFSLFRPSLWSLIVISFSRCRLLVHNEHFPEKCGVAPDPSVDPDHFELMTCEEILTGKVGGYQGRL